MDALSPADVLANPRLALALSGGGFRASLFHLGTLRRLAEEGWLDRVDVLSTVSGGSLLGGFLALRWQDMLAKGGTPDAFDATIVRPFLHIVTRTNFMQRWVAACWKVPFKKIGDSTFTRTKLAGALYSEMFYDRRTCVELPVRPYLVLNASSLLSIRAWRFTRAGLGDSRFGHAAWGSKPLSLGEAAGASAAFPPVFPPPRIRTSDYDFGKPIYNEEPLPRLKYVPLSDGGIYDNLGVEVVQKPTPLPGETQRLEPSEFLVISDAGYPAQYRFRNSGLPLLSEALLLYRVDDIAREQVSAQRRRDLVAKFQDSHGSLKGVLITLGSSLERLGPDRLSEYSRHVPAKFQIPRPLLALIRSIRTQLDRFTEIECDALMYQAYTLTDAVLWAYRLTCPERYRTAAIPAPRWKISFTSDVVEEWTRGLAKSNKTLAVR
jgi:NTE family protein